ncbi:MAG TPA: Co2+/Mg2+ efflux protein ApaG [Gammaproteobacteria bacterium]|jgi:ApaG protein
MSMKNDHEYRIEVSARSTFVRDQSVPDEDKYVFAYTVTIRNTGTVAAQLKTRHWIITDAKGNIQEVRGEGVVGEQPHLSPGESFRYTSAAMLETPVGTMHGSYQMTADDGTEFVAPIPPFGLALPNMIH